MNITVTLTHKCGFRETTPFSLITLAVRYAESVANNERKDIISVLMKGPDGEREFIS